MSWIAFDCRKELPGFTLDARWESSHDVVALVGRSGSGKTMTLRCIAGLERPDRGSIRLGDRLLFDSAAGVHVPVHRRRVGFVFQHYALFPHLRVRENVLFGFSAAAQGDGRGGKDRIEAEGGLGQSRSLRHRRDPSVLCPDGTAPAAPAVLRETLALCRLEGLEARYPRELSGGQRQRVAIARALASRPAALLLDEPFAALDSQTRDEVMGELRTILRRSRVPAVLVTHDAREAAELAKDLITIEAGAAHRPPSDR